MNAMTDASSVVRVREMPPADIDTLLGWRMEVLATVFADEGPWDAEALREANRSYFEQNAGGGYVACVASVDGEDAGCGVVCFQQELPSPDNPSGTCAYLMNIYTRSAFRHHGVGRVVVEWLVERAEAQGAGKIYLEATEIGQPLYEEAGFKPMQGMMKLEGVMRSGERNA